MADDPKKIEAAVESGVKKALSNSESILRKIEASLSNTAKTADKSVEEEIEGKKAQKVQQDNEKQTIGLLGGILKGIKASAKVAATTGPAGVAGKGLMGLASLGLGVSAAAFFGTLGGIAGVLKSIINSPAFIAVKGAFKILSSGAKGLFGGLTKISGLQKPLKWLGDTIGKFKGTLEKITTNKTFVKAMGVTMKVLSPFTRLASWLFIGYEFFQGWGKADKIFGKEEGDATIFEKFAAGLGGIVSFLTFDLIPLETAAKSLKDTFDFLVLAWKEPDVAWTKVKDWWKNFSFDESIVQPMLKMFEEFPKTVKTFIDGPLSTFGSKSLKMVKGFIFGEDDPEGKGEGTTGLWGAIKSLFTAKNIRTVIEGIVKLQVGFYKMLGKIVLMPIFGTGDWKLMEASSWGGIMGGIYNLITGTSKKDVENIGIKGDEFIMGVSQFLKDIFWHDDGKSGLLQKAMAWFKKQLDKFNVVDIIKNGVKGIKNIFSFGDDDQPNDQPSSIKPQSALVNKRKVKVTPNVAPRSAPKELGGGLSVPKSGVDWDFISKKEGGSLTDGYVPNPEGSKSGVTIATGFDLGARNIKGLDGLPASLKAKLAPYLGMQGLVAKQYLDKYPLVIKKSEAKLIDKLSKGQALSKLKKSWNDNAKWMKKPKFEDLTSAQQTVVASVAFQYGSLDKAPKFRAAAQEGRWDDVQGELRNFGDAYGTRRVSEADYLMAARKNTSGQMMANLNNENSMLNSSGTNGGNTVIAPTVNNNTASQQTAVVTEPNAKDPFWNKEKS